MSLDKPTSDSPAETPAVPGAPGYPSRDPLLDPRPGFRTPPPGYGEVSYYWWHGDPVTRERLAWQLETLPPRGISGLQLNYAHCDEGGYTYGMSMPSDPPLFSEEWWELFGWFMEQAKKRGIAVSVSDYTLGSPGQGWFIDEILAADPGMCGSVLEAERATVAGGDRLELTLPDTWLTIMAYPREGETLDGERGVGLSSSVEGNMLRWTAPPGSWEVVAVHARVVPVSVDPMHPRIGARIAETFFQRFEDRFPGESGRGLNFFFSDEFVFGLPDRARLWSTHLPEAFQQRKGYDLMPHLSALLVDLGPLTPKVRLDYTDAVAELIADRCFRPSYEWHQQRGMLYGCDHGWRGWEPTEYGDYFRSLKWYQGPGCDQLYMGCEIIKNKVASSIGHLYERPRTWLEGFYNSGWSVSSAQLGEAVFRNYTCGHNLLSLHGYYYSTHGGWWEWAPPCNHFHQPYWRHIGPLMESFERLGYLMSQGVHQCDVAVLYPVAPEEDDPQERSARECAFDAVRTLYGQEIDLDFIDFESLERAELADGCLRVAGERYRVLVLPSMRTLRYSTLECAAAFVRAGGMVINLGDLPEASDHAGRADPALDALVRELFGCSAAQMRQGAKPSTQRHTSGGVGLPLDKVEDLPAAINAAFPRDFSSEAGDAMVLHRRIGPREVYQVYGAPKGSECTFRARGAVEWWDPWTGETHPLYTYAPTPEGTRVRMPLDATQPQLIVFSPDSAGTPVTETTLDEVDEVSVTSDGVTVAGYSEQGGKLSAQVLTEAGTHMLSAEVPAPPEPMPLEGPWEFELVPSLDNQWGDYRLPAFEGMIGAEQRRFRYRLESAPEADWHDPALDDSDWPTVTCGYGLQGWMLGSVPTEAVTRELEEQLAALSEADPSSAINVGGVEYTWQPYEFSWRWGPEHDTGRQGWHGLKGRLHDEFLITGTWHRRGLAEHTMVQPRPECLGPAEGQTWFFWTALHSDQDQPVTLQSGEETPKAAWLNGQPVAAPGHAEVAAGANPLLLRHDSPSRGYVTALTEGDAERGPFPLAMSWYRHPRLLLFDAKPQFPAPAGWYRFTSPPGLKGMTFNAYGEVQAWVEGSPMVVEVEGADPDGLTCCRIELPGSPECRRVALRVAHQPGLYGGSALPDPISYACEVGELSAGDWGQVDGLSCYSGGAWYRRTITLDADQAGCQVLLDLGDIRASAEVHVNGELAGILLTPPWTLDISSLVRPGDNRLEVLIYNTIMNHYQNIPTEYRGSTTSGLLGPAQLRFRARVRLEG